MPCASWTPIHSPPLRPLSLLTRQTVLVTLKYQSGVFVVEEVEEGLQHHPYVQDTPSPAPSPVCMPRLVLMASSVLQEGWRGGEGSIPRGKADSDSLSACVCSKRPGVSSYSSFYSFYIPRGHPSSSSAS
ncbi:hypothetical protein E2C01_065003 [Portunus trituberculatus]|uniref:Uncharacterized protein n=1 Tax=Portunus trituberculatus TaxID=210409 RepID=A0A5B7HMB6_PORTR|nr:hypothetical protein [Portunus trituberculatus]